MVWVGRSGRLTGAPAAADAPGRVLGAALAAPVAPGAGPLGVCRLFLGWRRMAAWDAGWAVTEPQWTGRR